MLDLLVFDFDGVLCDSSRETFVVAVSAFRDLAGASVDTVEPEPAAAEDHPLFPAFMEAMPLGNRAEDFAITLAALREGVALTDQAAYDAWADRFSDDERAGFHHRFYQTREQLRSADPERWLRLHRPYPEIEAPLRRLAARRPLAIATAKDAASVHRLLEAFGTAGLFDAERLADKEAGRSKRQHLRRLAQQHGVPLESLAFVDDKVNHLEDVAPLGVRCVLAGWGYNGERERHRAAARGFVVAMPASLEESLAG